VQVCRNNVFYDCLAST